MLLDLVVDFPSFRGMAMRDKERPTRDVTGDAAQSDDKLCPFPDRLTG